MNRKESEEEEKMYFLLLCREWRFLVVVNMCIFGIELKYRLSWTWYALISFHSNFFAQPLFLGHAYSKDECNDSTRLYKTNYSNKIIRVILSLKYQTFKSLVTQDILLKWHQHIFSFRCICLTVFRIKRETHLKLGRRSYRFSNKVFVHLSFKASLIPMKSFHQNIK